MTVISCQGCGKEIHYGFSHFTDCTPIANGDCDCLGRMIDDAQGQHCLCKYGPDLMRPTDDGEDDDAIADADHAQAKLDQPGIFDIPDDD